MHEEITWIVAPLLGYLSGSVPFGVVLASLRGIDLKKVGSGNIGATNAARAMGKGVGLLVLALDALKATLPILILPSLLLSAGAPAPETDEALWLRIVIAAAAFLGHLFPVFLRFHGGKGVATAFGAFLALLPQAALLGLLCYAAAYGLTRISSLGSIASVLLFPLWLYLFHAPAPLWGLAAFTWVFILWKHRGNIVRLLSRQEKRI